MAINALHPNYAPPARDVEGNFHGNRVVYVHWEDHLSFCAAMAFPLPGAMPFAALKSEILAGHYGMHPDWASVDWDTVKWELDGKPIDPKDDDSLESLGFGHKSLLRFWTPGLTGYRGSYA